MMNAAIANNTDDDDLSGRLEDHKLWPNARSGLLHLVAMLKADELRFEPTPKMKAACGVTMDSHWKKCHQLMRDWLADHGYDLVNQFSREGGYSIARWPVQTFREMLKSTFRSLGHLGSANIRGEKLVSWLDNLPQVEALQFIKFKTAMGFLMANSEHMKKNIREIERQLPAMAGVADEVTSIPNKLLDPSRAKFIQPQTEADFDLGISVLERSILATRAR
jgi:hypothetical protein